MSYRNGIEKSKIDAILANLPEGLTLEDKTAWIKVQGRSGGKVYIAKQKVVRQIDLSAFEAPDGVKVDPPKVKNGKVVGHLNLDNEEEGLKALQTTLEHLAALPAPEPKVAAATTSAPTPEEMAEQEAAAEKEAPMTKAQRKAARKAGIDATRAKSHSKSAE